MAWRRGGDDLEIIVLLSESRKCWASEKSFNSSGLSVHIYKMVYPWASGKVTGVKVQTTRHNAQNIIAAH